MTNYETLFPAKQPEHAERDQHHAAARPCLCLAHYFYDHDAVAREQREPGHPVERREKSADSILASANHLDRSQRNDSIQQSRGRSGNADGPINRSETEQS